MGCARSADERREMQAMQAEDFAAWFREEREKHELAIRLEQESRVTHRATSSADDLGRVIIAAHLTCDNFDGMLEYSTLELHLRQRVEDCVRVFLELNELKPALIRRYLVPLSNWLDCQLQHAPTNLAFETFKVQGDLTAILQQDALPTSLPIYVGCSRLESPAKGNRPEPVFELATDNLELVSETHRAEQCTQSGVSRNVEAVNSPQE